MTRRDLFVLLVLAVIFAAALAHGVRGWNAQPSFDPPVPVHSIEGEF